MNSSFNHSSNIIKSLNATDFKKIIDDSNVQLVDVRTPEEYKSGTIGKAMLIDAYSSDFEKNADILLDTSRPVAVFCHSGTRSLHAAKILAQKGFPAIYNLKGGIMMWR